MRSTLAFAAALAAAVAAAAGAQDGLRGPPTERAATDRAPGGERIAYGSDPAQTITLWKPTGGRPAPLIVFVHGGGWSMGSAASATGAAKVAHFTNAGYALASIDYRLVPAATVEQQAADVAAAVARLRREAPRLGLDPSRVVLMGHSAGAHLVALVGTDPRYLAAAGLTLADLRGVIALDGAAYDVPRQVAGAGPLLANTYAQAFGADPARQRALSPTLNADAPNAPAFLILHVQRPDGIAQSRALGEALRRVGTAVEEQGFAGEGLRGHMAINRDLGLDDYPATAVVDRWLARTMR